MELRPATDARCSTCGKVHPRGELELSFLRPDAVLALSAAERKDRVRDSDDLCAIGSERFFIRAVLPLPVREWEAPYRIGIWVEVERAAFERVFALWDNPAQHEEPPFQGKLANDIPSLPASCGLRVRLQLTTPTTRPVVLMPESEHDLYREQSLGITAHRAGEYSSYFK